MKKLPEILVIFVLVLSLNFGTTVKAQSLSPLNGTVTLDQTAQIKGNKRVFRDGTPSSVSNVKPFPGEVTSSENSIYHEAVRVVGPAKEDYNVQIEVSSVSGHTFCVAYLDEFDYSQLSENYLADPGNSVANGWPNVTFSCTVPAGRSLVLVFSNVQPADPSSATYKVSFLTQPKFEVEVQTQGSGTASANVNSAVAGTAVTLSATPNANTHFVKWEVISPQNLVVSNNAFTLPNSKVTVKAVFAPDPRILTSILVDKPSKTDYIEGERLNLQGIKVQAIYHYGENKTITNYTTSPANGTVLSTKVNKVTVTYKEAGVTKTAEFPITVASKTNETKEPAANPETGDRNNSMFYFVVAIFALVVILRKGKFVRKMN